MQTPQLSSTFLVLDSSLACTEMPVTPTLYEDLDSNFSGFKSCMLVAEYSFSESWPTWEIHPHGDEILYLLEGEAEMRLLDGESERVIKFDQVGSVLKIPKGTWHTARISSPCRMLFITPGEGTRNVVDPRAQNA